MASMSVDDSAIARSSDRGWGYRLIVMIGGLEAPW
jgi:hypothetical protein